MPAFPSSLLGTTAVEGIAVVDSLESLSSVVGWSYFVAWSASFYPQVLLNYRRKHVGGLSIDFTVLNLLGHSSYALYNISFYFNKSVQEEYRRRHDGSEIHVGLNDVAYSVHASILTLTCFLQTLYYPRDRGQRLSTFNRVIVSLYALVLTANVFGVAILRVEHLYDFVRVLSVFKLYVSVAKYIPQAYENYSRKSTVGWSIENVLLDFLGGSLSFMQLFIDALRSSDWASITGNVVKFGLSVLSMLFPMLFIIQHFVLYSHHEEEYTEKEAPTSPVPTTPGATRTERTPLLGP